MSANVIHFPYRSRVAEAARLADVTSIRREVTLLELGLSLKPQGMLAHWMGTALLDARGRLAAAQLLADRPVAPVIQLRGRG